MTDSRSMHPWAVAALCLIPSSAAFGQQIRLLKDIDTRKPIEMNSHPAQFVLAGNHVYFATDDDNGAYHSLYRCPVSGGRAELWWRDTSRNKPILRMEQAGGELIFQTTRTDLWKTGSAGTAHLGYADQGEFAPLGNKMVFTRTTTSNGREIWGTDGTVNGTGILADIRKGTASSNPGFLTAIGGTVYFLADDGTNGQELWRTDGTASGTTMVKDILPGSASSSIRNLVGSGNKMWFNATNAAGGIDLWRSDGTSNGTTVVVNLVPGVAPSPPEFLTPVGNDVFFLVAGTSATELWKSDGSATGTVRVAAVGPLGVGRLNIRPVVLLGRIFFAAPDGGNTGALWCSDSTNSGTIRLSPTNGSGKMAAGSQLAALGVRVVFPAGVGSLTGDELWVTDGTPAGTALLKDINPGSSGSALGGIVTLGNRIWFKATDGVHGVEPWMTDGTLAGTRMVDNISIDMLGANPERYFDAYGKAWFFDSTRNLWQSDGTTAGTKLVAKVPTGSLPRSDKIMTGVGRVFLRHGWSLGVTDGTAAGTKVLVTNCLVPEEMVDLGNVAIFAATSGGGSLSPHQLWRTDGTAAGTYVLGAEVEMQPEIKRFARIGNKVFFAAPRGLWDRRLWVTDGTRSGTKQIKATRGLSMISSPVVFGNRIAFLVQSNGLCITDGTTAGTVINRSVPNATAGSILGGDNGVFMLFTAAFVRELWFSDGTAAGTRKLLAHNNPYALDFMWSTATIWKGKLYFRGYSLWDAELWVSDGTVKGTYLLKDINSGAVPSSPQGFVAVGDRFLYFYASRPSYSSNPYSLWRTDGTRGGTTEIAGVPGPVQETRYPPLHSAGRLFMTIKDPKVGTEPFVLDLWANSQAIGHGCAASGKVPVLVATDPILGANFRLTVRNSPASSAGVTVLGLPPAGPGAALRLPGGCVVVPTLNAPWLPLFFMTSATGTGSVKLPVPRSASLIQMKFAVQSAVGATATPVLGTDLSRGLLLTPGY